MISAKVVETRKREKILIHLLVASLAVCERKKKYFPRIYPESLGGINKRQNVDYGEGEGCHNGRWLVSVWIPWLWHQNKRWRLSKKYFERRTEGLAAELASFPTPKSLHANSLNYCAWINFESLVGILKKFKVALISSMPYTRAAHNVFTGHFKAIPRDKGTYFTHSVRLFIKKKKIYKIFL